MPMSPRLLRPIASGFDPRRLAGLVQWLDASDSSTVTLNSGAISEWRSKSSSGVAVSQGTALNQPAYVAGAKNGRAVARFASGNHLLGSGFSLAQPFTTIAAFIPTTNTGGVALVANNLGQHAITPASGANINVSGMNLGTGYFPLSYTSAWQVFSTVANGTNSIVTRDLGSDNIGNAGTAGFSSDLLIGARSPVLTPQQFFVGDVGEILIYNKDLTRTERMTIAAYLNRKWAIV